MTGENTLELDNFFATIQPLPGLYLSERKRACALESHVRFLHAHQV